MKKAHAFVAGLYIRDFALEKPPTHVLQLDSGRTLVLSPSRKKAVPNGLKGGHFIVSIYDQVEYDAYINGGGPAANPLEQYKLSTDDVAAAFVVATGVAQRISQELFGCSGLYRIGLNGPGAGTRPYFHVHALVLFHTKDEFVQTGFCWTQLIAADTHFIGC